MRVLRTQAIALTFLLSLFPAISLHAADDTKTPQESQASAKENEIADRIFYREAKFDQDLKPYTPMVETYIQNYKGDDELGQVPTQRQIFHRPLGHEQRHAGRLLPANSKSLGQRDSV